MAEVIELNNHKLLNGDATNKEDVDKLIGDCTVNLLLTDPPYGINIVNTNGGGQIGGQGGTAIRPFRRQNRWSKTSNIQEEQSEHRQDQGSKPQSGGQKAYGKVGKPRRC